MTTVASMNGQRASGLFDEIVLQQVLQWHHMLTGTSTSIV